MKECVQVLLQTIMEKADEIKGTEDLDQIARLSLEIEVTAQKITRELTIAYKKLDFINDIASDLSVIIGS